ncbi:MAG: polysaccharide biosynthesis/export family protein, partial [Phycisphaerales bacterium]|nr:polysaccharide biosynthesis/export family protein [Phycisphaerales bacterium]
MTDARTRGLLAAVIGAAALGLGGCGAETDGFLFDQSKTGYFEHQPTMIPILERIDVIEGRDDFASNAAPPLAEDLLPSDLTYRLTPGDFLTVEIEELLDEGRMYVRSSRVDASGLIRIPSVGSVQCAGLTVQELEDELIRVLEDRVMTNPRVTVALEDGGGFSYTMYGFLPTPGIYAIRRADFHLMEALATAGGVPQSARRLYVIRQIPLTDQVEPLNTPRNHTVTPPVTPNEPAPNIDDLIDLLDGPGDAPANDGSGGGARRNDDSAPGVAVTRRPSPGSPPVM